MAEIVNVIVKEDPSVQKTLDRTAKKLKNKYSKRRPINQKAIKSRTPFQVFTNVVLNVLTCILVVFAGLVCISSVNSSMRKVCPSFAGYSNFRIVSPSMVASGHKIGDTIIVRAVDAKTLKPQRYENGKFIPGDKIAFYQSDDVSRLFPTDAMLVEPSDIGDTKYTFEFNYLFGTKNSEMIKAAQSGCNIVFHHVYEVREDANGVRWFKTYGSTNGLKVNKYDTTASPDSWWVREDLIVGVYDDAPFSLFMSKVIGAFSASGGVFLLFIPVGLLVFLIIKESVRDVQMAKLELDCVEEKRKITDEICIRNGIGYRMSKKMKYKILVQADEKDRLNYISLMWRDNTVPREVKKYVLRKQALMRPTQRLLEVNRQCQQMFREGVDPQKIAKYYAEEKEKVEAEEAAIRQRVRELRKTYEAIYLADKAEQEKMLSNKKNRNKFETIPEVEFLPDDDIRKQKFLKKNKAKLQVTEQPVEQISEPAPAEPAKQVVPEKIEEAKKPKRKLSKQQEKEKNEQVAKILLSSKAFAQEDDLKDGGLLVPKSLLKEENVVSSNEENVAFAEEENAALSSTSEKVAANTTVAEALDEKESVAEIATTSNDNSTDLVNEQKVIDTKQNAIDEAKIADENAKAFDEKVKVADVETTESASTLVADNATSEPAQVGKPSAPEQVAKVSQTATKQKSHAQKSQKDNDEKAEKKKAAKKPAKAAAVKKTESKAEQPADVEDKSGRKPRAKSKKVKRVFTTDAKRLPRARKK